MSEPNQLYARVRLSRPRFAEFVAAPFPDPSDDPEVLAWLAEAQYYGPRYTPERIRSNVVEGTTTIGAYLESLAGPGAWGITMPCRNSYDEASQTWTLAILDFSENYDDYIAAVAVLRAAAKYKDLPGDDGVVIYGFMFENGFELALRIVPGSSHFLPEEQSAVLIEEAAATIQALMDEAAAASAG